MAKEPFSWTFWVKQVEDKFFYADEEDLHDPEYMPAVATNVEQAEGWNWMNFYLVCQGAKLKVFHAEHIEENGRPRKPTYFIRQKPVKSKRKQNQIIKAAAGVCLIGSLKGGGKI